jgi:ABC-type nickel/cobalt efflux system permease component RcnA
MTLEVGLVATAFAIGFRHGFDWDHVAAIGDIAASQESRRRSMMLATLYALGHAVVAFAIGAVFIVAAARVPESAGEIMERVVGLTLVALGVWVIVSWARSSGNARMPSRAQLLLGVVRRLRRRPRTVVVIEHEHEHPVSEPHVHAHDHERVGVAARRLEQRAPTHRHRHTHVATVPHDPFPTYGGGASLGVGMLHGVGFETPTQALVFVTAAGAGSRASGVLVLTCFLVGLLFANTLLAAVTTLAFTGPGSRARLYTTASLVAAAASLALGLLYLIGKGDVLPG